MKKIVLILLAFVMILNLISCGQTKDVEVIKCTNCGATNAANTNFCANCGSALVQKDTESTHSTPGPGNDFGVMQNSGADCIYYGNNICVDGDIIYIGYYGQLLVFCGEEVVTYASGGSAANAMAEMYLYNGYVYYANHGNDSIYRMNVADGEREIVLSGIGEIDDTFMRGNKLYIDHIVDGENDAISVVDLDSHESELLFCKNETVKWMFYKSVDKNLMIISEELENFDRYSILDAKNATAQELFSIDSADEWACRYDFRSDGDYIYFDIYSYNTNEEKTDDCYRVRIEDYTVEKIDIEVYNAATHISFDDKLEWEYYLAWGSNNLCREHKETKVQEVLVKSGSGNREEGEIVAKTYAIREILYADDTRIIFERGRMADGLEISVCHRALHQRRNRAG